MQNFSLFPIFGLNLQYLLRLILSLNSRINFPFKNFLDICCLSTNAQRLCLDLLSLSIVVTTDSRSNSTSVS